MASLWLLNSDAIAVPQLINTSNRRGLASAQALQDGVKLTGFFTESDHSLLDSIPLNDKNEIAAVLMNDRGLGHQHSFGDVVPGRRCVSEEIDSDIHLRTQLLIRIFHLYFYLHGSLRAIRLGCYFGNEARVFQVWECLWNNLCTLIHL